MTSRREDRALRHRHHHARHRAPRLGHARRGGRPCRRPPTSPATTGPPSAWPAWPIYGDLLGPLPAVWIAKGRQLVDSYARGRVRRHRRLATRASSTATTACASRRCSAPPSSEPAPTTRCAIPTCASSHAGRRTSCCRAAIAVNPLNDARYHDLNPVHLTWAIAATAPTPTSPAGCAQHIVARQRDASPAASASRSRPSSGSTPPDPAFEPDAAPPARPGLPRAAASSTRAPAGMTATSWRRSRPARTCGARASTTTRTSTASPCTPTVPASSSTPATPTGSSAMVADRVRGGPLVHHRGAQLHPRRTAAARTSSPPAASRRAVTTAAVGDPGAFDVAVGDARLGYLLAAARSGPTATSSTCAARTATRATCSWVTCSTRMRTARHYTSYLHTEPGNTIALLPTVGGATAEPASTRPNGAAARHRDGRAPPRSAGRAAPSPPTTPRSAPTRASTSQTDADALQLAHRARCRRARDTRLRHLDPRDRAGSPSRSPKPADATSSSCAPTPVGDDRQPPSRRHGPHDRRDHRRRARRRHRRRLHRRGPALRPRRGLHRSSHRGRRLVHIDRRPRPPSPRAPPASRSRATASPRSASKPPPRSTRVTLNGTVVRIYPLRHHHRLPRPSRLLTDYGSRAARRRLSSSSRRRSSDARRRLLAEGAEHLDLGRHAGDHRVGGQQQQPGVVPAHAARRPSRPRGSRRPACTSGSSRSSSRVDAGGPRRVTSRRKPSIAGCAGGEPEHHADHRLDPPEALVGRGERRRRAGSVTSAAHRSTTASSSTSFDGNQ